MRSILSIAIKGTFISICGIMFVPVAYAIGTVIVTLINN